MPQEKESSVTVDYQDDEPRPNIPVLEPEVIEGDARQRNGDYDKVATTTFDSVLWRGIQIQSRYAVASELELMLDMIETMTKAERAVVRKLFCDSKRGNDFSVELRVWDENFAKAIAEHCSRIACSRSHGHSGISVHDGDMFGRGPSISIDSEFPDGFDPNDIAGH